MGKTTTTRKGRKANKGKGLAKAKPAPPAVFSDGTKAGDVLRIHRDEAGETVGRLVRTVWGGAIWQERCPNPGGGRPSNEVRAQCRESLAERIPRLQAIIDDPRSTARDVVAAASLLARIGIPQGIEVDPGEMLQSVILLPRQALRGETVRESVEGYIEDLGIETPAPLPLPPAPRSREPGA